MVIRLAVLILFSFFVSNSYAQTTVCAFNDPVTGDTPGCTQSSVGGGYGTEALEVKKNGQSLLYVTKTTANGGCTLEGESSTHYASGSCSNYRVYSGAPSQPPAPAQACQSLDDFYLSVGCNITADTSYRGSQGKLNVRIIPSNSGRNINKLFHIVGPYQIPNTDPIGLDVLENQINQLSASGIDVVYYDFAESNNDYIQNKSRALMTAMKKIDDLRGDTRASIMAGLSMGGVVARHALTTLESDSYKHGVKYYISFDAPHLGAHIPQSLQHIPYFMDQAVKRAEDDNDGSLSFLGFVASVFDFATFDLFDFDQMTDGAKTGLNAAMAVTSALISDIESPAGKQMIHYNVHPDAVSGYGQDGRYFKRLPEASSLVNELNALGMPSGSSDLQTTNIAITKGSLTDQSFTPYNNFYINFDSGRVGDEIRKVILQSYVLGASSVTDWPDATPGCPALSCAGDPQYRYNTFRGFFEYKDISDILTGDGKDDYAKFYFSGYYSSPTNQIRGSDIFPCSTLDLPLTYAASLNHAFQSQDITKNRPVEAGQHASCFIPVDSALAMDGGVSPFDVIYGSSTNTPHAEFRTGTLRNGGNGSFFEDDLMSNFVADTYIQNASWSHDNIPPSPEDCDWVSFTGNGGYGWSVTVYRPTGACAFEYKEVYTYSNGSTETIYR